MKKSLNIIVSIVIMFFSINSLSAAEINKPFNRTGDFGVFLTGQFLGSDSTDVDDDITYGVDAEIGIDDTDMYGIGFEYNITQHLNININALYGQTDGILKMNGYGYQYEGKSDVDIFAFNYNIDCNILKSRFTPVISVGIGFMTYNIDDVYGSGEDVDGTEFTYNIGAGFRWDVNDALFIKTIYKINWVEIDDTDSPLTMDGVQISVGFKF